MAARPTGARPSGILGDLLCEDLNDACCWACSGGGDVVCCDGCRAVYHLPCIGLKHLPKDDWFCPLCHCKECDQSSRTHDDVQHISTKLIPVRDKSLQPRRSSQQRLPTGPGYLCPQRVRQWLTQQRPHTADVPDSNAQHTATSQAEAHTAIEKQRSKRHKLDSGSSSDSLPPSNGSGLVRCCGCQQACHVNCLPTVLRKQCLRQAAILAPQNSSKAIKAKITSGQQQHVQQQVLLQPYFCSPSCQQVASHVAERCAQGLVQVDSLADGTPVCWQLIQPAAVAAALLPPPEAAAAAVAASFAGSSIKSPSKADSTPGKKKTHGRTTALGTATVGLLGTGIAPAYSRAQAEVLAQVLRDVQQLMQQQLGPAWEVRTFQDTLPWLLSGLRCDTPGGLLDLSHFHVATLWVGSTLSAAALVRLHGTAMLEVSQAATLEQLQHKQLGRLLVSCVERFALETCQVKQAWMPALGGVVKPCVGVSVLPSWERPAGVREALKVTTRSSLKLLGLRVEDNAPPAAGTSTGQQQQQVLLNSQQQTPKDLKSCWALQLRYGPAPSVVDWLQVPKHLLLRYSYVPFVTKRLRPETLIPMPRFRKQEQRAGPASAGAAAGAAAGQQVTHGHATARGSVSTGAMIPPVGLATGASGGHAQQHATGCYAAHHQRGQPHHALQQSQQQVLKTPLAVAYNCEQQPATQPVQRAIYTPRQGYSGWCHVLEQAAAMCLQPQLHQLPPRQSRQKVLQEHMQQQQQQQQMVKQQLNIAAQLPLADACHSVPAAVDARVAVGSAAYGSVGSVVGVAGVHQQQQP